MKTISLLLVIVLCLPTLTFTQSMVDKAKDAADKAADAAKIAVDSVYNEEIEVPKAIVRGRVYYEETGQPLRRTWIGFVKIREIIPAESKAPTVPNEWEYSNSESVLTNDFGEFVMKDVEPGVYQAILKLPGILNPTSTDRESTIFQQFVFDSGSESRIDVGVKRGGAVSGFVRYPDGAPLIGAEVYLLKVKPSTAGEIESEPLAGVGPTETDDRGYYRFAGLPEGEYLVLTSEPSVFDGSDSKISSYSTSKYYSTSELKTYFPSAKSALEASKLQVYRGEELRGIDILLAPRELFEVSGLVVGARDNKLVDGIEIEFEKAGETVESDYQKQMIRTTTTDSEGRWKFKDLLPGKYVAKISEPSYRRYRDEQEEPLKRPNYASTEHKFEVIVGENRDVIFRIAVEGSISGVVTVEGNQVLPDTVEVHADSKNERVSSSSVETMDYESDGPTQKVRSEFTVDDLKAGEYYLTVKANEGYFAKSIIYQGKNVLDAPIIIKEAQQLKDVRVVLSSGSGTVEGKVADAVSSPNYIYVYLMPVKEGVSLYRAYLQAEYDYVGDENTYEIQAKPGDYYLFVKTDYEDGPKKNAKEEELEVWVRDQIKNAQRIKIARGQTLQIDLNMPQ